MILPQRDQLHKRLQSVQTFVENFCIKPIQKESRNAINNATTDEKRSIAANQARQAAQLTQDFQEASALGEMLAPLSRLNNIQSKTERSAAQNAATIQEEVELNQPQTEVAQPIEQ